MPGGHSKFDEATGKWSTAKPAGAAVVRKSAGWINSTERFIWVVYLVGNGKRVYIRGHSESLDPKALEHAKNDAQEIVDAVGGTVKFFKTDGFRDTWYELPVP
jgi:hypothetical protein